MKPLKPLLALFCIALAASPAAASVLFKGLQYSPVGSAVVDVGADRRLSVSNLGSSGQDGVSVSCLHMSGMQLALAGDCSPADAGASCTFTYHWSLLSQPAASRASSIRSVVGPSGVSFTTDVADLSSSPTQTLTLSRAGVVVYSAAVPAGAVLFVAMDASGACPNPTL